MGDRLLATMGALGLYLRLLLRDEGGTGNFQPDQYTHHLMTTISSINGAAFTSLSALDGISKSSLSAVDGLSFTYTSVAEYRWTAYQVGGIADGASLTSWPNQGTAGSNNAVTNGTAPIYRATLGPSGKPTIEFNGTTQSLGLTSGIAPIPVTYLAVIKLKDSNNRAILSGTDNSNSLEYRASGLKQEALNQFVSSLGTSSTNLSTSAFQSIGMDYNNATLHFFLSGAADGTISIGPSLITQNTNRIGLRGNSPTGEFWADYISEIRIFTSVLSSTVRNNEIADLLSIWGV